MTTLGQMRHVQRAVIVAFHRTLVRPYLYPLLAWIEAAPATGLLMRLTRRQTVLLGVVLGLLLAMFAEPTVNPNLLR